MKLATKMNHFALRSRMYLKAVQAAFQELQSLHGCPVLNSVRA
jgi:hypothetical protein